MCVCVFFPFLFFSEPTEVPVLGTTASSLGLRWRCPSSGCSRGQAAPGRGTARLVGPPQGTGDSPRHAGPTRGLAPAHPCLHGCVFKPFGHSIQCHHSSCSEKKACRLNTCEPAQEPSAPVSCNVLGRKEKTSENPNCFSSCRSSVTVSSFCILIHLQRNSVSCNSNMKVLVMAAAAEQHLVSAGVIVLMILKWDL